METRRRRSFSRLATLGLLAGVAGGMIVWSLDTLAVEAGSSDLKDLAAAIEEGRPVGPKYLLQFAREHAPDAEAFGCADTAGRAAVTVTLAAVSAAEEMKDRAALDGAEATALAAVRRRLNCNPLDGNAWLRLSQIESRTGGVTPAAIAALKRSYETAPNESWVMLPRLAYASKLYLANARGFEPQFLTDLQRYAEFMPVPILATTYVEADPRIRALLHPMIAAQSAERFKAITAEVDRLGMLF